MQNFRLERRLLSVERELEEAKTQISMLANYPGAASCRLPHAP